MTFAARVPRAASLVVAALAIASRAIAQEPPQLPPPPPPKAPPQYTPPSSSPPPSAPPPKRERETREAPHREREREREAPVRARSTYPAPVVEREGPTRTVEWFQAAFRTGIAFPAGGIEGDSAYSMGRDFNAQLPFLIEAGVRVHPMIVVGGYGEYTLGGVGQTFHDLGLAQCGASSRSCGSASFHIGAQIQVHFRPGERIDPWVGYGLGYESAWASSSGGSLPPYSETFGGFEFARLAAGADFRINPWFGLGPFLGIDFGDYSHQHTQGIAGFGTDQSVSNTALHEWITLGVRAVLFP
jgi:hypothetical protein